MLKSSINKIVLLCFFLLIGLLPFSYTQLIADYTVYYDFTCISDTTTREFFNPREYMLLRVENKSTFITSGRYYNDSTHMVFSKEHPEPAFKSQEEMQAYLNLYMGKRDVKPVGSDHKVFKNFETGRFRLLIPFDVPSSYLEEPMDFNWEITNEIDTILGLSCTKAITNYGGRRYYAWFAPEVPINDGPWTFQGLPGLMIKITDDQGWYDFMATNIITKKTKRYLKPDWVNQHSRKIDRKAFVDRMTHFKHNPGVPQGILNFPEERLLERKRAYAKRFDLLLEQY